MAKVGGSSGLRTLPFYAGAVPTVFVKDGFRFFFYSNDHRPIHVHVRKAGKEAVFNVEDTVDLRESVGFNVGELRRAEELATEHRQLIIKLWNEHIG